jgi:hypothetical protein
MTFQGGAGRGMLDATEDTAMPTTQPAAPPTSDVALFGRLIKVDERKLAPDLARYILTLGFDEADQTRMRELAERNQEGKLSPAEREQLQSYVKAGHLLALLHSKVRRSLRRRKVS